MCCSDLATCEAAECSATPRPESCLLQALDGCGGEPVGQGGGKFGGAAVGYNHAVSQAILRCAAVLFDLDGVLVDSREAVSRQWRRWAVEHHLDPDWVEHVAHGRPSFETMQQVTPEVDPHEAHNEMERREAADVEGVRVMEGARELLASIPAERWTIVTSCTPLLARVRLNHAGIPSPARMVTFDDVRRGKPDPEPYLKGAELLGFAPETCLVVEDAPAGIQSGKAAGMRVLALATTYPMEDLEGADVVVPGIADVRVEVRDSELSVIAQNVMRTVVSGEK